ncbi:piggyBac transposable element-derived protein 4-like [Schistocerca serialis cubense]|uniref:piggyBac transposable element-derived protein 4-like n=1 Tax=Schistocerca serialis cubense TaxID=2023355 RepID=UPI00214E47FD|nr:piggyBac transposable element-derived protein 4-like [Schistocerca serialis cubense]
MSKFLANTETERLLNETFVDSSSKGDISESEYSDFASEADSGYVSIAFFRQNFTSVIYNVLPNTEGSTSNVVPSTESPRKRRRSSVPKSSDAELGWTALDMQPSLPEFKEESGRVTEVGDCSSPFDIFSVFIPESVVKHIKAETNRYVKSIADKIRRSRKMKPNSMWSSWTGVQLHEMYLFFAVIIHMCLVKKNNLHNYWSTNSFVSTPSPGSVLARNRFFAILSCLHVNDNVLYIPRDEPVHNPMYKIRPFLNHLLTQFPAPFSPEENLTINEGYVLHTEVYTGKGQEDNLVTALFQRLLSGYLKKGQTVYMDRYYTSPAVFDFLLENKMKAVGASMPNRRGLPKQGVVSKKLKKG